MAQDRGPPIHTINFEPVSNDEKVPALPMSPPPPVMSNRDFTTPPQHQERAIQVRPLLPDTPSLIISLLHMFKVFDDL